MEIKVTDLSQAKRIYTKFVLLVLEVHYLLEKQMFRRKRMVVSCKWAMAEMYQSRSYCKTRSKSVWKSKCSAPPMSVPHIDSRMIDGQKSVFGPFAGFFDF
jgi:malate dehydrogenase (quinone)